MAAKKKLSETSVEEMCDLHDQVRDLTRENLAQAQRLIELESKGLQQDGETARWKLERVQMQREIAALTSALAKQDDRLQWVGLIASGRTPTDLPMSPDRWGRK